MPALPTFDGSDKDDEGVYKRWVAKLKKHAELLQWSNREKLLQFELHLTGKAEHIYEVLPPEEKRTFLGAVEALGKRVQPAKREALSSAQLLQRRQRIRESVDDFVREFEQLFKDGYGHRPEVDSAFKAVLKRDLFVQGLLLKWQEKVLPTTTTFADALHLARAAEEQERQLGAIHPRQHPKPGQSKPKEESGQTPTGKPPGQGAQSGTRNKNVRCHKCHGLGHYARECPLRKAPSEA